MMRIDDETLMAYVDGELEDAEAERVREALARDGDLEKRARMFRQSASVLRDTFQGEINVPVPKRLEALLSPSPTPAAPGWLARLHAFWTCPPSLAFAAGLLLAVGAVVGHLATGVDGGMPSAPVDRLAQLQGSTGWNRGFERTASGEQFMLQAPGDEGVSITPLATFLDSGDRFCRAFRQAGGSATVLQGIVCRDGGGSWTPVVVVAEATPATPATNHSDYRPASAEGGGIFDRVLEMQMTTSPFAPGDERALIEHSWRPAP